MTLFEQIAIKMKNKKLMKMGFDGEFIEKNEMLSLDDDEINYIKSNEEAMVLADVLARIRDINFVDAFRNIRIGCEKYGLTPMVFTFNGLYNKDEEAIARFADKMAKKRRAAVESVAEVTGWSLEKAQAETDKAYNKYGFNPNIYYEKLYYNLTDAELAEKKAADDAEFRRCIDWVKSETGWTDYEVKRHRYYCKFAFEINPHSYFPTRCWQMDDETLKGFARQRDSRRLRDRYNTAEANEILSNKILFNEKFGDLIGRRYWVNRDTSYEEFLEFADGLEELFCKPVDLSHASGTRKIKVEGDMRALYEELISQPKTLVEECVKQHHEMSEFYENAVNTVRLFCLIDDGEFVPFAGFVRFGADGVADNIAAGGVGCGLDVETGTIDTPAIDRWHQFNDVHPVSGKKFEGFRIPNWDKVLELAEKGLRKYEGLNYVGWDIAICEDKAVLIEGNDRPSIATYQMFYGFRHEGKRHTYEKYLKKRESK
ncbi:MAG: sugar-transfer associated ATP-grasp domain-containing protein [Emergencia sp.]